MSHLIKIYAVFKFAYFGLWYLGVEGRFLEFRKYHNFANSFSTLSESTFYKKISKVQ